MTKKHNIILQPSGRRGQAEEGMSVRSAARELGVEIESICAENATCGKCMVLIEEGRFEKYNIDSKRENVSPVTTEERAYLERRPKLLKDKGWEIGQVRLSCQAKICGDVLVNVPEESRGNKQIVRKSASNREIEVKPSVRKYLVSMSPPTLERPIADWERLAKGLETSMALVRGTEAKLPRWHELTIDYQCLRTLSKTLRDAKWNATVSVWQDKEVIEVQAGYVEDSYGAAVDIGSTTVALYLCNLRTGEVLASESEMNPQIVYGEDVMSRIQYTIEHKDGLEKLHKAIISTLNKLLKQAVKTANTSLRAIAKQSLVDEGIASGKEQERPRNDGIKMEDILEMVLVGNSTMHHILLNLHPKDLGLAPFVPAIHESVDVKARELGLHINASGNIHILPTIASFVGADTSAVILAEEPHKQDENWLLIDVGTNAELVLGNRKRLVCTSTPTGPALEGAHVEYGMRAAPGAIERVHIDENTLEPKYKVIGVDGWNTDHAEFKGHVKGICGSAIIDSMAELFRAGIVDSRGKFKKGLSSKRIREGENGWEYVIAWAEETSIGRDIPMTQQDVRQIQLAKAALFTAARTLLKRSNLQTPDKIILAGGFGSYIDKEKAMLIGLIPDCELDKVYAVGNAAGDGARIALLNIEKRNEIDGVTRKVDRFELPTDPEFQNNFMLATSFPHMSEPFEHIAHLIPHRVMDPLAKNFMK